MGIISWIIFGFIAGLIAKALRPGKDPAGCVITILIGIAGAVIGGWIGMALKWGDVDGFNLRSFFLAVIGAILLLYFFSRFTKRN